MHLADAQLFSASTDLYGMDVFEQFHTWTRCLLNTYRCSLRVLAFSPVFWRTFRSWSISAESNQRSMSRRTRQSPDNAVARRVPVDGGVDFLPWKAERMNPKYKLLGSPS